MPRELSWQYVLILPVCGESPQFWPDLLKQTEVQSVLVIMLVNRPELHENTGSWQKINADFLGSLYCGIGSCMQWSETEWNTAGDVDFLLIIPN